MIGLFYSGASSKGRIAVFKTADTGSIPVAPTYFGDVAERLMATDLKSVKPFGFRGFESPRLRTLQYKFTIHNRHKLIGIGVIFVNDTRRLE